MPTPTQKLGIPKPLGNETVSRAAFNEILDTIDQNAASQTALDAHIADRNNPHGVTAEQVGAIPDDSGTVTSTHLASGAVTAGKLADGAVDTLNRIASGIRTSPGGTEANRLAVTNNNGRVGDSEKLGGYPAAVYTRRTTTELTLYVNPVTGNDANDGLTPETAFRTIQHAVDTLPKFLAHKVTIQLAPGTYTEKVSVNGLVGFGTFAIKGADDLSGADAYVIDGTVSFKSCTCLVTLQGVQVLGDISVPGAVNFDVCPTGRILYCKIDKNSRNGSTTSFGVSVGTHSMCLIQNCDISNVIASVAAAIQVFETSRAFSWNNTGSNNAVGLRVVAGTLMKSGTQPSGATAEQTISGGVIR